MSKQHRTQTKSKVSINVAITKQARRQALKPLSNPISAVVCKVYKSDRPVPKQILFSNAQRVK